MAFGNAIAIQSSIMDHFRAQTPVPELSDPLAVPASETLSAAEISTLAVPTSEPQPAAGMSALGGPSSLADVSAPALLENSATRLEDLDGQITGMFGVMDARRSNSDVIGTRMSQLQLIQTALNAAGRVGNEDIKLKDLTIITPEGPVNAEVFIRRNELTELLQITELGPDAKIGPQVQTAIDQTRTEQSQLNGRTEQDMMQLQQLVQQRGQVIELTTKLLDAIHQSQKAILSNLGR